MSFRISLAGQDFQVPQSTVKFPALADYNDISLIDPIPEPSKSERRQLNNAIGSQIGTEIHSQIGKVYSRTVPRPLADISIQKIGSAEQKDRAAAITILFFSILVSAGLVAFGAASGSLPLLIASAIASGCLITVASIHASHVFSRETETVSDLPEAQSTELELLEELSHEERLEQFKYKTFPQIIEEGYTKEEVIGHDLFAQKLAGNTNQTQKQLYYWRVGTLFERYIRVQETKTARMQAIQRTFANCTGGFTRWQQSYQRHLNQVLDARSAAENLSDSQALPESKKRPDEVDAEKQLDEHFKQLIQPWEEWKDNAVSNIERAAAQSLNILSNLFLKMTVDTRPASAQSCLTRAVNNVKNYPLFFDQMASGGSAFKPKQLDWDDIESGMTERWQQLPRLLLLELLQTSTPKECIKALCFNQYHALASNKHVTFTSERLQKILHNTTENAIKNLQYAVMSLAPEDIVKLAEYLACDGPPHDCSSVIKQIYTHINEAVYPLQYVDQFREALDISVPPSDVSEEELLAQLVGIPMVKG